MSDYTDNIIQFELEQDYIILACGHCENDTFNLFHPYKLICTLCDTEVETEGLDN